MVGAPLLVGFGAPSVSRTSLYQTAQPSVPEGQIGAAPDLGRTARPGGMPPFRARRRPRFH
jgi:hypothetical protein